MQIQIIGKYTCPHSFLYHFLVALSNFIFPTAETVSVNGSSSVGRCSDVSTHIGRDRSLSRCNTPITSVLFDGNITVIDRNMSSWASDLLTMRLSRTATRNIIMVNLATRSWVDRVEFVMFNCPEWGQSIRIQYRHRIFSPTIHSCHSLVRVCRHVYETQSALTFGFQSSAQFNWVHLAEVTIYADRSICPPDSIIPAILPTKVSTSMPGEQYSMQT